MSSKTYRLLRDNKEQGPFTSEELILQGLKPYDLIWIDGRSAAWSYPGELSEFKLYVPVPEEQPFDRFFKKETSSSVSPSVQAAVAINGNTVQGATKQPKPRYRISAAWSRIQTITVPLNREKMVTSTADLAVSKSLEINTAFQLKPLSWEDAWRDWEKEKNEVHVEPLTTIAEPVFTQKRTINEAFAEAPVLETKCSQPLDAIKDRYIGNVLQQKKSGTGFSLGRVSELIIPCIALFVIFSIGYWLLHGDNKTASALSSTPLQTAQPVASNQPNEIQANLNASTDNNLNKETATANQEKQHSNTRADNPGPITKDEHKKTDHVQSVKLVTPVTKNPVSSKKVNDTKATVATSNNSNLPVKKTGNTDTKQFDPKVINNIPKDNAYNDQSSGSAGDLNAAEERPVRRRTNGDQTNEQPDLNDQALNNQPTVSKRSSGKANMKYVNVPQYVEMNDGMGSVKIENVSDVDLDLVVVDVQYYDASSRFRKGETLYLHNLKAGRSVVVKTPRDVNSMYALSKVSLVSADSKGVYIVGDN